MAESTRYVGTRRPRIDGREKVIGATRYAADLTRPGLLHARVVGSIYAHARIRGVDAEAALAVPGVVAVLTAKDLPIVAFGEERRFEPLADTEAVFAGQPVALVIASSEAAAADAARLVVVDVEPLPVVVDVLAATEPGAPLSRVAPRPGAAGRTEEDDRDVTGANDGDPAMDLVSGNVFSREQDRRGDMAAALARCDAIVEGRFRAGWVYQSYMEPHAATAWLEPDGTLALTTGTQGTFYTRDELAVMFGLSSSKVRVTGAALGGAFGAKQMVVEPLVAGAALRLRSPVRLVMDRLDDFAATNPAQGILIDLRIGAARSGRFEALQASLTYDAGAYSEWSWQWFAAGLVTGPYRWPAFDVRARGVTTNRFPAGNYRAPSGPQGLFALESLIDELAGRLGLDPIEVRAINAVVEGDPMSGDEPWPRIGVQECLQRLGEHPMWTGRTSLPAGEGVGLAIGVWRGSMEPAAATCRLEADGMLTVITGVVDMSGSATGFAAIAAETFGVPVGAVSIVSADTSSAPPSPSSNASAITYGSGLAVQRAVADARDRLLRVAADDFEIEPGDLEIVDGIVRPKGSPGVGRAVAEFARTLSQTFGSEYEPVEGHAATAHTISAPSAAGHLAHVRVDAETGAVELLGYAVVQDVGRALNPALVEGQMVGGAVQSIGMALYEELVHDERGQLMTGTFLDYAIPRAAMLPAIDTLIVEVPAPEGPFGAKGIGEASILPGPAAIANAIAAATGQRMRELPMTPRRIRAAARSGRASAESPQAGDGSAAI